MSIITSAELHGTAPRPMFTLPVVKPVKPVPTVAPRIDMEPIYTGLKQAIGEHWQLYKATVAEFITGKRNQAEMTWIVDPFLCGDPAKEALHNQLILAVFANAQRDAPEPGVAVWVAANDKPTATTKPVTGDAAEQRLKSEIMHLPPRERRRIRRLAADDVDRFQKAMADEHDSVQIKLPDTSSAGGYNRTNWEPEVRKRYAQPLFVESNDFDAESIQARMQPICYEEGIFNGFGQGAPDFMNLATESFVKNTLSRIFGATWSNGRDWIQTDGYKRRRVKEEAALQRGDVRKNQSGLLPVEREAERSRQPLSVMDFRTGVDLGGMVFGRKAPRALAVFESMGFDDEDKKPQDRKSSWAGGAERDRKALNSILDDCLRFV